MFERFFGSKEITQEEAERMVFRVMEKQLSKIGVNGPGMNRAFKDAQELNKNKNLGLTNNHLLNLTKQAAHSMGGPVENFLYGGADQTADNIENEIEVMRSRLSSEEKTG